MANTANYFTRHLASSLACNALRSGFNLVRWAAMRSAISRWRRGSNQALPSFAIFQVLETAWR
ncbi:MAG: hypothetical protein IH606_00015 [Burkholderiales bacterium]|nr:hypothetical protein [Burkholderiales bacterium]